jgi:hypothetical protein
VRTRIARIVLAIMGTDTTSITPTIEWTTDVISKPAHHRTTATIMLLNPLILTESKYTMVETSLRFKKAT